MVKVNQSEYDGQTQHSISLSGMGEEEEVIFTTLDSEIGEGQEKPSKFGGTWIPKWLDVTYHKGEENVECRMWLTDTQVRILKKLQFKEGEKFIAFKTTGKANRLYVNFKRAEAAASASSSAYSYSNDEMSLARQCKADNLNFEWTMKNFEKFKTKGMQIGDLQKVRISNLMDIVYGEKKDI